MEAETAQGHYHSPDKCINRPKNKWSCIVQVGHKSILIKKIGHKSTTMDSSRR